MIRALLTAGVFALAAVPAFAGDIAGAGSGSTGGVVQGRTSETNGMMQTGVATGQQPSTAAGAAHSPNANPDNAVMTAPHEAVPGTKGSSLPSTMNGQTQ